MAVITTAELWGNSIITNIIPIYLWIRYSEMPGSENNMQASYHKYCLSSYVQLGFNWVSDKKSSWIPIYFQTKQSIYTQIESLDARGQCYKTFIPAICEFLH